MISLAFARAALSSSLTLSCAWARFFCALSAAARPSAIFCWRSSMAFINGGQMNLTVNQMRIANDSIWPSKVIFGFMSCPADRSAPRRHAEVLLATHGSARLPCVVPVRSTARGVGDRGGERIGEGEHHRHADADQERRVDQAGEQEHAAGQHRREFGLAGDGLEELRTHDADAERSAHGAEADDEADAEGGEGLDLGDEFHCGSPG